MDLQIALMTIKVILKGRVSSQETLADTDQVRSKSIGFGANQYGLSRLPAEPHRVGTPYASAAAMTDIGVRDK